MTLGRRGRHTISPVVPAGTSASPSSTIATSKSCRLGCPAAPGLFSTPAGSIEINDASVSPYPPLNVEHPNRARQIWSIAGGIGAAAQSRSRWPAWSGWSGASAMSVASEPSSDTIVAPVRRTSGQKRDTEKRRAMLALPPLNRLPTTQIEMALKWNSGSGVRTTSSARRCHARAIWSARLTM